MMMMVEKSDKGSGGAASPQEIVLGVGEEKGSASVRTAETLLRILPMALCVTALVTMLKNSQDNSYGAVSYSDVGGFRYLVYANGICAGYSLLSAFCTAMPHSATISWAWTVFFFDQVLTYMILAAGTVSAEVMYLAYKGDEAITWSDACESFGGFCKKATASVAITFVVVACYAGLSLISSYRLFSNYKPPIDCPGKEIESAHFTG